MNQPLLAGQERLANVIDMAIRHEGDALTLKRIEREMQGLLDRHAPRPEIQWLVMGFTAFLAGNSEECVRRVEAALRLAPFDVAVVGNAGMLFANIGEPRRLVGVAETLAKISDGNFDQLASSTLLLGMALQFEGVNEIMERHGQTQTSIVHAAQRLAECARARGISSDLRLSLLETAISAVRSHGFAIRQSFLRHYPDDSLRYEIYIDASAETCGELNFEIAEKLVEAFDDCHPEFVTFACRPLSSYEVQDFYVEVTR